MAVQDEITVLRRLMESINRATASNAASVSKLLAQQQTLQADTERAKEAADRALQMCNDLAKRIAALERK